MAGHGETETQGKQEKGEGMEMADMGYAVIDRRGRLRGKTIDGDSG